MVAEAGRLVVGTHGLWQGVRQWTNEPGEDQKGHLVAIDYASGAIEDIGDATPIADHDGLTADGQGRYITSDFVYNSLTHIDRSGRAQPICQFHVHPTIAPMAERADTMKNYPSSRGPADIRFYPDRRLLLVPFVWSGELAAFEFSPETKGD